MGASDTAAGFIIVLLEELPFCFASLLLLRRRGVGNGVGTARTQKWTKKKEKKKAMHKDETHRGTQTRRYTEAHRHADTHRRRAHTLVSRTNLASACKNMTKLTRINRRSDASLILGLPMRWKNACICTNIPSSFDFI